MGHEAKTTKLPGFIDESKHELPHISSMEEIAGAYLPTWFEFVDYLQLRETARELKEEGTRSPDPVLKDQRFCNVLREDDYTSRMLYDLVRSDVFANQVWKILIVRMGPISVNSFEILEWMHGNRTQEECYSKMIAMTRTSKNEKKALFDSAYRGKMPTPTTPNKSPKGKNTANNPPKSKNTASEIGMSRVSATTPRIALATGESHQQNDEDDPQSVSASFKLPAAQGPGSRLWVLCKLKQWATAESFDPENVRNKLTRFLGYTWLMYQVLLDLQHILGEGYTVINLDDPTDVIFGDGTVPAQKMLFGTLKPNAEQKKALVNFTRFHMETLKRRFHLSDLQHNFCEFRKYKLLQKWYQGGKQGNPQGVARRIYTPRERNSVAQQSYIECRSSISFYQSNEIY